MQIPDTGIDFITAVSDPSGGGSVRIADDGSHLIYTPAADFYGSESFRYTVGNTETAMVTVVVDPVNDPPRL